MKKGLILYFISLLVASTLFFLLIHLVSLRNELHEEKLKFSRLETQLLQAKRNLQTLSSIVKEENIPLLSREEALIKLLDKVDQLKRRGEIELTGELIEENNRWLLEVSFRFEPKNARELARELEALSLSVSPVVKVESLTVNTSQSAVEIDMVLIQPYRGR